MFFFYGSVFLILELTIYKVLQLFNYLPIELFYSFPSSCLILNYINVFIFQYQSNFINIDNHILKLALLTSLIAYQLNVKLGSILYFCNFDLKLQS